MSKNPEVRALPSFLRHSLDFALLGESLGQFLSRLKQPGYMFLFSQGKGKSSFLKPFNRIPPLHSCWISLSGHSGCGLALQISAQAHLCSEVLTPIRTPSLKPGLGSTPNGMAAT